MALSTKGHRANSLAFAPQRPNHCPVHRHFDYVFGNTPGGGSDQPGGDGKVLNLWLFAPMFRPCAAFQ